jgi:hypothetical protein
LIDIDINLQYIINIGNIFQKSKDFKTTDIKWFSQSKKWFKN